MSGRIDPNPAPPRRSSGSRHVGTRRRRDRRAWFSRPLPLFAGAGALTALTLIGTAVVLSGGNDDFSTVQPRDPCPQDGCEPTVAAATEAPPVPRAITTASTAPTARPTPGRDAASASATARPRPSGPTGRPGGASRPPRPDDPPAEPPVTAAYQTISSRWWSDDFKGSYTIVNRGDTTLRRWELRFMYTRGRVDDLAPGDWRTEGNAVIAVGGSVPPGGRVLVTFEVEDGRPGPPQSCTINGRPC